MYSFMSLRGEASVLMWHWHRVVNAVSCLLRTNCYTVAFQRLFYDGQLLRKRTTEDRRIFSTTSLAMYVCVCVCVCV